MLVNTTSVAGGARYVTPDRRPRIRHV